jgi:Tat protein translocase TatB subunit
MLNIGMGELLLIMGIALVVLGPEKFPVFAKVVMHTYRDFMKYKDEIMTEVRRELAPVRKELSELSRFNPEDYVEGLALAVSTEPKDEKKDETKEGETAAAAAEGGAEGTADAPADGTAEASAAPVESGGEPAMEPNPAAAAENISDPEKASSAPAGTYPRDEYPYSD